jgi:hypothetical protein
MLPLAEHTGHLPLAQKLRAIYPDAALDKDADNHTLLHLASQVRLFCAGTPPPFIFL